MYDSSQMFSHARKLQSHSVSLGISSLTRPQLRKQCMTALSGAANFEFVESRTSRDGKMASRHHFRLLERHDVLLVVRFLLNTCRWCLANREGNDWKKPASVI